MCVHFRELGLSPFFFPEGSTDKLPSVSHKYRTAVVWNTDRSYLIQIRERDPEKVTTELSLCSYRC